MSFPIPRDNHVLNDLGHIGDHNDIAENLSQLAASSTDWINVTKAPYNADPTGIADSTSAIQNAINSLFSKGGGVVYLPTGTYKISSALTLVTQVILQGDGTGQSFSRGGGGGPTVIKQTSTTAHGVYQNDATQTGLRDLMLLGPSSGSGCGIYLTWTSNTNVYQVDMQNLQVSSFGSHGVYANTLLGTNARMVISGFNGGDGFHLVNTNTSCVWDSCAAPGNTGYGWYVNGCNYLTFNGCAADGNANGWYLTQCQAISINGSGTENNTTDGLTLDGGGPYVVNGFWVSNHHYGVHVTAAATGAVLAGIFEVGLSGAVYSIFAESGSKTVLLQNSLQTAQSIPSAAGYGLTAYMQDGVVFGNQVTSAAFAPTGVNGANFASRYIGGTDGGVPAGYGGPYYTGDYAVDQDGLVWITTNSSGGGSGNWVAAGSILPTTHITANYTALSTDCLITADPTSGSIIITIPLASVSNGREIAVVQTTTGGGNSVTIKDTSSAVIGATFHQYEAQVIRSDGSAWYVVGSPVTTGQQTWNGQKQFAGGIAVSGGLTLEESTQTANYGLSNNADITVLMNGSSLTATLPQALFVGGEIHTIINLNSSALTIATTSSQTINGATTVTLGQYQSITVVSNGSNWDIIGASGFASGVTYLGGGTDTSGTATASSPSFTSGTAKQLSTTQDVMLYIAVQTSAALAVAIGPTSTPANTIMPSQSYALGLQTIRVPKGWWVKVTGTIADLTITQVTC